MVVQKVYCTSVPGNKKKYDTHAQFQKSIKTKYCFNKIQLSQQKKK